MKTAPRTVLISLSNLAILAVVIATAVCTSALTSDAGEGLASEPYSVFVSYDKAFARCGPSSEYYRTDPLRHGQKLQVYVETDDGWLGVRPPEESFCWVPASTVKTSDRGQSGEVIEDRTVAWIGTNLGRAKRYRWQVQLAEGEPVSIIGRSEREGPDGPQLWYRIVPPSGEFRWVHRDQVVQSAEELVAKATESTQDAADTVATVDTESDAKPSMSRFGNLADRGKSILAKAMPDKTKAAPKVASIEPAAKRELEMQVSELLSSTRRANDPMVSDADRLTQANQASSRRTKPLVKNTADANALQPVPAQHAPVLSAAPRPQVPVAVRSEVVSADTVGSGLRSQWQTNANQTAANPAQPNYAVATPGQTQSLPAPIRSEPQLAAADFVSRPRLIDIGSTVQTAAPGSADVANDGNWIVGAARQSNAAPLHQSLPASLAMSGQRNAYGHPVVPVQAVIDNGGNVATPKVVSQASIQSIAAEARDASVEQLHLMLSRLMASSATAIETQPIAEAAGQLASSSGDDLITARARLLNERVVQYQRIAQRRDGQAVVRADGFNADAMRSNGGGYATNNLGSPVITASANVPASGTLDGHGTLLNQGALQQGTRQQVVGQQAVPQGVLNTTSQMLPQPVTPPTPAASGYLVQVYSARQNSPPYALTDNLGNTIAYVTPSPGVNLRHHINSEVTIAGSQGYVQGLNTPHIIANEAIRVASGEVQGRR
ncbi:hypothetical protein [Stieleria marina]|uniref:Secreted protein n=1 Tax=Stieleria marina TaxID=1930275 RepID=A0A517P106_9BACT|nr:hypothetical protein K239x_50750 [Planctomycetes bacterium K23_9]